MPDNTMDTIAPITPAKPPGAIALQTGIALQTRIALKNSIAAKIFSLAVFLLVLTITLTGFLLWEVAKTEAQMREVATHELPLSQAVSHIDYTALRRRLAFERWFGALNAKNPNQVEIKEASAEYGVYKDMLRQEAEALKKQFDSYPANTASAPAIQEVRSLFEQLVVIYPAMTKHQMDVLALQQAGEHDRANDLLNFLDDTQNTVQSIREKMDDRMSVIALDAADRVAARQSVVLWIALGATASTVLLGLVAAAIIANHLVRPMRSLVSAMGDVQRGNLPAGQLSVNSKDEVGQLTNSFNYFVDELRAKEMIKRTFGKYIDPRVLERVLMKPEGDVETVSRRVMTVSFADIVGFSGLSERLTPSSMVAVLNRHFELQATMVHQHQGVVDKFIGDALMTFWGPPFVAPEEHAVLACRAALAQLAVMDTLRQELPEITGLRKDTPQVELRIGICTGDMVVGNIGSESSRSYTVIGDTVNLASRLEGANRIYGTRILLGETTRKAIGAAFETREIDMITVKGREEPTRIYELLGAAGNMAELTHRLCQCYSQALQAYRSQDWDSAEAGFRECLALDKDDQPSRVFLTRIETLRHNPPGDAWNGVWQMKDK